MVEQQRVEAYRNYMSDSFAILHTALTRGTVEVPRYSDLFKEEQDQPQETQDQVVSRFDKLRRDKE